MTKQEILDTIMLLERIKDLRHLWIEELASDPVMEMSLFLMKRHLTGRITTLTSLAQSASVPYTTATRRVTIMQNQGLLDLRPRTATGLSFSVHPSSKLISKITSFLMSIQSAFSDNRMSVPNSRKRATKMTDIDFIGAPSVASAKLGFADGLDILVVDDPAYSISKPLRRELSYLMGGQVRFTEVSIDELRNEVLANSQLIQSKYDVIAVDLPMIAEFAMRNVLMPLDKIASDSDVNSDDFVLPAWNATIVDEKQYAIPILINPQLLFYRKDVFTDLHLSVPLTTTDMLNTARQLHNPEKAFYGVSWTGARGAPVGQAFIQFLADFGQPIYELERSIGGFKTHRYNHQYLKPLINTERGHATAHFMKELLDVSPPNILNMGWLDQVDLLRKGQVAMSYEWACRASQLSGFSASGELGFLSHPSGLFSGDERVRTNVTPIGGFAFGIPANIKPERLTVGWNAIEFLSSPEVIKLLAQHGGYATPRISVASDPDVQQLSPMIAEVSRMAKRGQIRLWPRPPVASYSIIVSILGEEIHDMLNGRQSVSQALSRSQKRIENI